MTSRLDAFDLSPSISREESERRILAAQRRLVHLRLFTAGLVDSNKIGPGLVVLFEGFDAAGKGGAIRNLTGGLDPRHVRVVPIGPPTEEDLRHHFLWRFQETIPGRGSMTVYDRSWYGRLLVERVEGLIDTATAKRSAEEIVEFERAISDGGVTVVKFWLQISDKEQLRRFKSRERDPYRSYKLTEEDWRNRAKTAEYTQAVEEMLERTSTSTAPWTVVEANDKWHARVKIVRTVARAIKGAL